MLAESHALSLNCTIVVTSSTPGHVGSVSKAKTCQSLGYPGHKDSGGFFFFSLSRSWHLQSRTTMAYKDRGQQTTSRTKFPVLGAQLGFKASAVNKLNSLEFLPQYYNHLCQNLILIVRARIISTRLVVVGTSMLLYANTWIRVLDSYTSRGSDQAPVWREFAILRTGTVMIAHTSITRRLTALLRRRHCR